MACNILGVVLFVFIMGVSFSSVRAQDSTHIRIDTLKHPKNIPDSLQVKKNKELQKFRKVFEKVVKQQKKAQKKKVTKDPTLDLGVLILDRTRSPMGRQFYHLFYQHWKAPKGAGNTTITIGEKPLPGLGSLVTIKVGYNKVFKARLQPRRQYIKALSKKAVARCRKIIKQNEKVRKQLTGY